jgi:hypothetical protein
LYVALVEAEDYKELTTAQQKLNEAVMEMNQRLQVSVPDSFYLSGN